MLDAKTVIIRQAKTIKEITQYAPELRVDLQENLLICQLCFEVGGDGKVKSGAFNFDFESQVTSKPVQSREFINLKTAIVKHFESKSHNQRVDDEQVGIKMQSQLQSRNFKVGNTLGRQAYKILSSGGSYLQFENDICVLQKQGLDTGNINNSRKFISEYAESVYAVIVNEVQKLVNQPLPATGRPTPIALISDKITPNRRTMQICGFHGLVDGKVQSLIAGVPSLSGEDGLSVTKCLRTGISNLNIPIEELPSRLVGGAFDGEYLHLGVPNHLLDMMLVGQEGQEWYSFQWDPAHILELAEADSRKACGAIKKVISTISEVSQSFSHGKSFRELVEEAESCHFNLISELSDEQNQDLKQIRARVPGHFSATRFATYSSEVYKKFLHNFRFYYNIMNRQQDDDLDRIDNAPFLFSCAALCDVYQVIGSLSNDLQKPNCPPWEFREIRSVHVKALNQMSDTLDRDTITLETLKESGMFPHFMTAADEVFANGEYKGCAILDKLHTVNSTRRHTKSKEASCNNYTDSLKLASKSVKQFIDTFVDKLKARQVKENDRNRVLDLVCDLFDVKKIVNRKDNDFGFLDSLSRYLELAKYSGNVDYSVTYQEVEDQYKVFSERIADISPDFIRMPKSSTLSQHGQSIEYPSNYRQLDLYNKLLNNPALYKNIPIVLHLALTGICRTHCEAVVEGMGSVLGRNITNRTSLNPKTVERETVIRWQGPHPASDDATKVVQQALDLHFKGRDNWHFCVTWDKAQHFMTSQVVDRITKTAEANKKISFK